MFFFLPLPVHSFLIKLFDHCFRCLYSFFQQQLPDLSMVTKNLLPFSVHGLAKRTQWDVTIHNGVPSIADPWFNFLHEKKLMPEDEVVFYYRLDDHAWELLIRKDIEWDNEDINFDNWLFFNEQIYFVFFNILNNLFFCYHPTKLVFLSRLTCVSNNILTTSSHNLQFLLNNIWYILCCN